MFSLLPLDDRLNQLFYVDGSLCRLVYSAPLGRCVLLQEAPRISFHRAVSLIASGEVLWNPPEVFERLDSDTPLEAVQQEHELLSAFLRSPAGQRITSWTARRWLMSRLKEHRDWAARRVLVRENVDESGDQDRRSA